MRLALTSTLLALLGGADACAKAAPPAPGNALALPYLESFEAWPLRTEWHGEMQALDRLELQTSPAPFGGCRFLRLEVRPGDLAAKRNRAEVTIDPGRGTGSEVWYAWAIRIPTAYADDPEHRRFQIVGQLHAMPDFAKGETWEGFPAYPPMVSIQYGFDELGRSGLGLFYGLEGHRRRLGIRWIEKGRWYEVRLRVRWSRGADGFVAAWLDGVPFAVNAQGDPRTFGPNAYNDVSAILKLGLYRDFGFKTVNTVHYDEVRIGSRLEEVTTHPQPAPGQDPRCTAAPSP